MPLVIPQRLSQLGRSLSISPFIIARTPVALKRNSLTQQQYASSQRASNRHLIRRVRTLLHTSASQHRRRTGLPRHAHVRSRARRRLEAPAQARAQAHQGTGRAAETHGKGLSTSRCGASKRRCWTIVIARFGRHSGATLASANCQRRRRWLHIASSFVAAQSFNARSSRRPQRFGRFVEQFALAVWVVEAVGPECLAVGQCGRCQ